MADDGPGHGTTHAAVQPIVSDAGYQDVKTIPRPKPMEPKRSTWTVSAFDIQASGMATPLDIYSRRSSIELEDYFVCFHTFRPYPPDAIRLGFADT